MHLYGVYTLRVLTRDLGLKYQFKFLLSTKWEAIHISKNKYFMNVTFNLIFDGRGFYPAF